MPYSFQQDVPINADIYGQIVSRLGVEAAPGLIAHIAMEIPNGLRYIDIWESREDHERFVETRLHPVVHAMLEAAGLGSVAEPEMVPLNVIDLWATPRALERSVRPVTGVATEAR